MQPAHNNHTRHRGHHEEGVAIDAQCVLGTGEHVLRREQGTGQASVRCFLWPRAGAAGRGVSAPSTLTPAFFPFTQSPQGWDSQGLKVPRKIQEPGHLDLFSNFGLGKSKPFWILILS